MGTSEQTEEQKQLKKLQALLDGLDEEGFPIPSALDDVLELGPELERLENELDAIDVRQTSSGETVVLRWDKSMQRRDFMDLIADAGDAIAQLRIALFKIRCEEQERRRELRRWVTLAATKRELTIMANAETQPAEKD